MVRSAAEPFLMLVLAVAACSSPEVLVLCHNANCAGEAVADDDDTLNALRASLALAERGISILDGVEIDLLLHSDNGECLFAHDPMPGSRVPAYEVGDTLTEHMRTGPHPRHDRFHLAIDFKTDDDTPHDALIDCAFSIVDSIADAARSRAVTLAVILSSKDPSLLERVVERPDWNAEPSAALSYRVSAGFGESPFSGHRLAEFPEETSLVSLHADNVRNAYNASLRQAGISLVIWQRLATRDLLGAIERFSPEFVTTNEPNRLRQWLSRE